MAHGAIQLNRDLTLSIEQVRQKDDIEGFEDSPDEGTMASLPELRRAEVSAALVKVVGRIHRPGSPLEGYRGPEAAYAAAQGDLAYYRILEAKGEIRILRTGGELSEHMQLWQEAESTDELAIGFILGMEGADPILWPEQVHEWKQDGIRVVSLTHYGASTYAHGTGTGTEGGLFPPAKTLFQEMESAGMILDVTHLSDASARQSLDLFSGPVLASHQNCRALVPGERQFPDGILRRIIDRDGVIGASMDTWMLYPPGRDWSSKIGNRRDVFWRTSSGSSR